MVFMNIVDYEKAKVHGGEEVVEIGKGVATNKNNLELNLNQKTSRLN
jgi:hypothetical protein